MIFNLWRNNMAQVVENAKGFRVIEINRDELIEKLGKYGSRGVCDFCNKSEYRGYYIAVLNRWYCDKCYDRWIKYAERYPEDSAYEKSNFERYKILFKI